MNKDTIHIASGGYGDKAMATEVQGTIVGKNFGVHKTGSSWTVTHLPTGLRVEGGIDRKMDAIPLAEQLDAVRGSKKGKFGKPEYLAPMQRGPMKAILEKFRREHGD